MSGLGHHQRGAANRFSCLQEETLSASSSETDLTNKNTPTSESPSETDLNNKNTPTSASPSSMTVGTSATDSGRAAHATSSPTNASTASNEDTADASSVKALSSNSSNDDFNMQQAGCLIGDRFVSAGRPVFNNHQIQMGAGTAYKAEHSKFNSIDEMIARGSSQDTEASDITALNFDSLSIGETTPTYPQLADRGGEHRGHGIFGPFNREHHPFNRFPSGLYHDDRPFSPERQPIGPPSSGGSRIWSPPSAVYGGSASHPNGPPSISSRGFTSPVTSNSFLQNSYQTGERIPSRFHPMENVKQQDETSKTLTVNPNSTTIARISAGFSPNYRGNINLPRNRSADIPLEENCSLFLVGLPPNTTTKMLLEPIRGIGRIYASHINRPEPDKGHFSSAAKIIFFEREGAHALLNLATYQGLYIGGQRARVVHNRIRTAEATTEPRHATRVLIIHGPTHLVNEPYLTAFFEYKLEFQIDDVKLIDSGPTGNIIEYRFGSYRCQSQAAKMALAREYPDVIRTWFGTDPCA